MSSRGTVPAWVIEKQQKQIALKREAERKKQVRQQIAKVATAVRADMARLNTEEVNACAKEEMEFGYAKRNLKDLPEEYRKVLEKFCKIYEDLPYMCFDMMKGKNGKVYVIESNAQPGVPFDSTVV